VNLWAELLAGVVMGFFGSVPVAGPVALVVVTRGLDSDFRGALWVAIGAGIAEGILAGLVFAGLGLALAKFEGLDAILDFAGVGVLLVIGAWFALKGVGESKAQGTADLEAEGASVRNFALGLGMVLGNPGMLGTWGGAVTALEGAGLAEASVLGAPVFGLGVSAGVVAWFWLVLQAIRRWRASLDGRFVDATVRLIGLALIVLGLVAGAALFGGEGG